MNDPFGMSFAEGISELESEFARAARTVTTDAEELPAVLVPASPSTSAT